MPDLTELYHVSVDQGSVQLAALVNPSSVSPEVADELARQLTLAADQAVFNAVSAYEVGQTVLTSVPDMSFMIDQRVALRFGDQGPSTVRYTCSAGDEATPPGTYVVMHNEIVGLA